jgi:hypothetical protein
MAPKKRTSTRKKATADVQDPPEPVEDVPTQEQPVAEEESKEEHVLLQLPISNAQLDKLLHAQEMNSILEYTPTIQEPVPYSAPNHFASDADYLEVMVDNKAECSTVQGAVESTCPPCKPKKAKVCFWCCHDVGHMTFGMPIRYDFLNKTFTMYGTFCSLECAAAHNFATHLGSDRAWEIHSWIQMLGKRYGYVEPVRPAPSRYLLQLFDGPLTIDEFRNAHKGQTRTYVLNIPPLISVNSQMEVVNTSFIASKESKAIAEKTVRKTAEKRKTLDAKMNLTIKEEST